MVSVVIRARQHGFRRCGIAHSGDPTEWSDDAWTPEQLGVLMAEPMLEIVLGKSVQPQTKAGNHQIMVAIQTLTNRGRPSDWTAKGLPQVSALEAILGYDITSAQRSDAWAAYQQEHRQ